MVSTSVLASEGESDRLRFTRQATYLYNDFLNGEDAQTLGIEGESRWGTKRFHGKNIFYFEAADYPRGIPGKMGSQDVQTEEATGITDLLTGFWLEPKTEGHSALELGYGAAFQFPTASDDSLGSGKWAAGPSIDIEYEKGNLFLGTIMMNLWSFAGDDDRKEVNMFLAKTFVLYTLNENWKLISIPYGITYYWNKPSSEALSLPLGGGVQRNFALGSQEFSFHAQYFEYVARSKKGSEADLRFTLEFYF